MSQRFKETNNLNILFFFSFFLNFIYFLIFKNLKEFLFYIGLQLIYNVVLVLGIQQRDSVIIYMNLFCYKFLSHLQVITEY